MALPLDIDALQLQVTSENEMQSEKKHDFHEDVDDLGPSVSPRDRLSYVADRREVRAIEQFDDNGQLRLLQRLLLLFRLEALKQRPDDIIDFGCEFFHPENQDVLRSVLNEESQTMPYAAGSALKLTASPGAAGVMGVGRGEGSANNNSQSVSRALFE